MHKAQTASKFVGRVEKSTPKCPDFPTEEVGCVVWKKQKVNIEIQKPAKKKKKKLL